MKNALQIFSFFLCFAIGGCNQPSTQKVRNVQDFSFSIDFSSFSDESGTETVVTPTSITKVRNKQGKNDTTKVKLTSEQTTQIKNALDRLPLEKLKPQYKTEGIQDGGGYAFEFTLDSKSYKVSYINHDLNANLQELVDIIDKYLPEKH
jgi:hypothetical protein